MLQCICILNHKQRQKQINSEILILRDRTLQQPVPKTSNSNQTSFNFTADLSNFFKRRIPENQASNVNYFQYLFGS